MSFFNLGDFTEPPNPFQIHPRSRQTMSIQIVHAQFERKNPAAIWLPTWMLCFKINISSYSTVVIMVMPYPLLPLISTEGMEQVCAFFFRCMHGLCLSSAKNKIFLILKISSHDILLYNLNQANFVPTLHLSCLHFTQN